MTLDMPTPESLEAEANELEARAARLVDFQKRGLSLSVGQQRDIGVFTSEAEMKRAKAERLRKAARP